DSKLSDCNLVLSLWNLVRASTAAPTYFPPEVIHVGEREFIFVDGGVTMYNNPAFQLFLMATAEPYNLCWPTGEKDMHLLYNAASIPAALMGAALAEQDFLCRTFGKCLAGGQIDSEIGDMIGK